VVIPQTLIPGVEGDGRGEGKREETGPEERRRE